MDGTREATVLINLSLLYILFKKTQIWSTVFKGKSQGPSDWSHHCMIDPTLGGWKRENNLSGNMCACHFVRILGHQSKVAIYRGKKTKLYVFWNLLIYGRKTSVKRNPMVLYIFPIKYGEDSKLIKTITSLVFPI